MWDGQLKIYVNRQFDGIFNTAGPSANAVLFSIGSSAFGDNTNWAARLTMSAFGPSREPRQTFSMTWCIH